MYLYKMDLNDRIQERERRRREITDRDKILVADALREKFNLIPATECKVLDFGCGLGDMVCYLLSIGYDAHGCDISPHWEQAAECPVERLALIVEKPYRLPYKDNTFDAVFSTSVLEHVRNTEESFYEIHRVLKPGGISMHLFPGKWYLPYEPHIRIPLANYFWPHCPDWWIGLWVFMRIIYIPRLAPYWKHMYRKYCEVCKNELVYFPNSKYRNLSKDVFGNYGSLMGFYIERAGGGYARLARKLGCTRFTGWLSANIRMNLIYQRKEA